MLGRILFPMTLLSVVTGCAPRVEQPTSELKVEVRSAEATPVLVREVQGDFVRHREILTELLRTAKHLGLQEIGSPIGIYPVDPDAFPANRLVWRVALPIRGAAGTIVPSDYSLDTLPAARLLAVRSTVAESHRDGLALKIWTLENGYIQTGPTRMSYLEAPTGTPADIVTEIAFPVRERTYFADRMR